jgi:DNA-binding MarR family transcriptional regulator
VSDLDRRELLNIYLDNFISHRNRWEAEWNRNNLSGLSSAQGTMLLLLRKLGPLQAKDLMGRLGVTSGGVTVIANHLIGKGLVTRSTGERDRRAAYFELTDSGRQLCDVVERQRNQVMDRIYAGLSNVEVAILGELFAKLARQDTREGK